MSLKDYLTSPIFKLSWLMGQQYWGDAICRNGAKADVQAILDYLNNRDENNNDSSSSSSSTTNPFTITSSSTQYQKAQDMQFSKEYFNIHHVTAEDVNKLAAVIHTMI
eukprot:UN09752